MAIDITHLKVFKPVDFDGGRLGLEEIQNGASSNIFSAISPAERLSGVEKIKKTFLQVYDVNNTVAASVYSYVSKPTPFLKSKFCIFSGTQRDNLADLTGAERLYSSGNLSADKLAGVTTAIISLETGMGALNVIQNGDKVIFKNASGYEIVTLSAATVTVDSVAITFAPALDRDYLASNTIVGSVIESLDVKPSFDNWDASNTVAGTYNIATYPLELNNIGTDEETLTITKGAANAFSVLSDVHGALPDGDITVDYAPQNVPRGADYLILRAAGWGGTWLENETITVQIHPNVVPTWQKLISDANAVESGTDYAYLSHIVNF